jgi:hypothetical protein
MECGGLPPPARRKLAPGMTGKTRFFLNAKAIGAPPQASLLGQNGGKPPRFHMVLGRDFAAGVAGARCAGLFESPLHDRAKSQGND